LLECKRRLLDLLGGERAEHALKEWPDPGTVLAL